MAEAVFFRLLREEVSEKAAALEAKLTAYNAGQAEEQTFTIGSDDFRQIPNSTFAYWVNENIRSVFNRVPQLEGNGCAIRIVGLTQLSQFWLYQAVR